MDTLGLSAKRDSDGLMKNDETGSKIPRLAIKIMTPSSERTVMSDFGNSGLTQMEMIGQDTQEADGTVGKKVDEPEYCGDDYIGEKTQMNQTSENTKEVIIDKPIENWRDYFNNPPKVLEVKDIPNLFKELKITKSASEVRRNGFSQKAVIIKDKEFYADFVKSDDFNIPEGFSENKFGKNYVNVLKWQ